MKEIHAYMHNHNSVILWCKATQEYSIPVSFLPLFSAPRFVLPYEMHARVKWRSRFIFSFKKAKTKLTMAKKLKNLINKKNDYPYWVLFHFALCSLLLERQQYLTTQISVQVNKAISVLRSEGRRIYTLVFLLKREIKNRFTSSIDWFIYLIHPLIAWKLLL